MTNLETITTAVIGDVAVITIVSTFFGKAARRLGQPTVVGQIIAGIVLGPSVLGRLPGNPSAVLFPAEARPFLMVLSQIAVVLFIFAAGYEIDVQLLRNSGPTASLIALAGLAVPMAMGACAAALLHETFAALDSHQASGRPFLLFIGVATSITALPVLAAIVAERGLVGTQVGTIAMTAAGLMDVGAWIVLAAALAGAGRSGGWPWLVSLLSLAGFTAAMVLLVRPGLNWWMRHPGTPRWILTPLAVGVAFTCAWATAAMGMHPIFGAFLAGICMPRPDPVAAADVLQPMEHGARLLLPLFFTVAGMSFEIDALGWRGLMLVALLTAVAVVGKVGPGYVTSRLTGLAAYPSTQIAVLINTRGLTEIVALNVGLSQGVIGRPLFTALVVMALLTTALTGPLLSMLDRREPKPRLKQPARGTAMNASIGNRRDGLGSCP